MKSLDPTLLKPHEIEAALRSRAVFMVKGTWPQVVQTNLPDIFTGGKEYLVVIVEAQ